MRFPRFIKNWCVESFLFIFFFHKLQQHKVLFRSFQTKRGQMKHEVFQVFEKCILKSYSSIKS